jgi:hypothetical protein
MPSAQCRHAKVEFTLDNRRILNLSLDPESYRCSWNRCGDFVEDVLQFLEPVIGDDQGKRFDFIFNELIENAVKFSRGGRDTVHVDIHSSGNSVTIQVTNETGLREWELFRDYYSKTSGKDPDTLYRESLPMLSGESPVPLGLMLVQRDDRTTLDINFYKKGSRYYVAVKVNIGL